MQRTTLEERLAARREQALMRWMIGFEGGDSHAPRGSRGGMPGWTFPREKRRERSRRPLWAQPRAATAALLLVILVVLWLIA